MSKLYVYVYREVVISSCEVWLPFQYNWDFYHLLRNSILGASSTLDVPGVVPAAIPAAELSDFTALLPSARPRTFPCSCTSLGMFGKCNYCKSVTSTSEALCVWGLLSSNRILVFKHFFCHLLFSRCWSLNCFIFFDNLFPLKGLCFFH